MTEKWIFPFKAKFKTRSAEGQLAYEMIVLIKVNDVAFSKEFKILENQLLMCDLY